MASKHRVLWDIMEKNFEMTKRIGLVTAKTTIRRAYLDDYSDIPNSCYCCEYAFMVAELKNSPARCFSCPVKMTHCSKLDGWLAQLTYAIQEGDEEKYRELCNFMSHAEIKEGVPYV